MTQIDNTGEWVRLAPGSTVRPGDLWWDDHLRKYKPPHPRSYSIPVMVGEIIIRRETP